MVVVFIFREYLWKFFYPPDYQPMEPTALPEPGQPRMWKSFDFKMSMQQDTTIDILFSKTKVRFLFPSHEKCKAKCVT